jgi:hypothetical protein
VVITFSSPGWRGHGSQTVRCGWSGSVCTWSEGCRVKRPGRAVISSSRTNPGGPPRSAAPPGLFLGGAAGQALTALERMLTSKGGVYLPVCWWHRWIVPPNIPVKSFSAGRVSLDDISGVRGGPPRPGARRAEILTGSTRPVNGVTCRVRAGRKQQRPGDRCESPGRCLFTMDRCYRYAGSAAAVRPPSALPQNCQFPWSTTTWRNVRSDRLFTTSADCRPFA